MGHWPRWPFSVWPRMRDAITDALDSITLQDLIDGNPRHAVMLGHVLPGASA